MANMARNPARLTGKPNGKGKPTPKRPKPERDSLKPLGAVQRRARALRGRRDNVKRLIAAKKR